MIWNKIQNIYIHTHTYIHFNNTCIHTYKWIVHCIWKNTCKKAIVNGALITELLSSKFQHTTTYIHTLSWIHAWCVDMFYFDFDNFVFPPPVSLKLFTARFQKFHSFFGLYSFLKGSVLWWRFRMYFARRNEKENLDLLSLVFAESCEYQWNVCKSELNTDL